MLGTGPRGEVVAAFSDQLQRKVSAETVDRGDVLSEHREERGANVESQGVHLIGSVPTPRRWNCPVITTAMDAQFLQHGLDSSSKNPALGGDEAAIMHEARGCIAHARRERGDVSSSEGAQIISPVLSMMNGLMKFGSALRRFTCCRAISLFAQSSRCKRLI